MSADMDCGMSGGGINIRGDRVSIDTIKSALHDSHILPEIRDQFAQTRKDLMATRLALSTILNQTVNRTQPTVRDTYIAHVARCALNGTNWHGTYAPREAGHRRLTRALLHRTEGAPDARVECVGWIQAGAVPVQEQPNG